MYAMMEDRDHTFEWLDKAYAKCFGRMEYMKMEDFSSLFTPIPAIWTCCDGWGCHVVDHFQKKRVAVQQRTQ